MKVDIENIKKLHIKPGEILFVQVKEGEERNIARLLESCNFQVYIHSGQIKKITFVKN